MKPAPQIIWMTSLIGTWTGIFMVLRGFLIWEDTCLFRVPAEEFGCMELAPVLSNTGLFWIIIGVVLIVWSIWWMDVSKNL